MHHLDWRNSVEQDWNLQIKIELWLITMKSQLNYKDYNCFVEVWGYFTLMVKATNLTNRICQVCAAHVCNKTFEWTQERISKCSKFGFLSFILRNWDRMANKVKLNALCILTLKAFTRCKFQVLDRRHIHSLLTH